MRSRLARTCAVLALVLAGATAARAYEPLVDVPLSWRPSDPVAESARSDRFGFGAATLAVAPLGDARRAGALVAQNEEDRDEGVILRVTTREDVARFVTTHLTAVLGELGPRIENGAPVTLSGRVARFFVVETNRYRGEVELDLALRHRDGRTLWSGRVRGESSGFGRSYDLDNYHEALSDALVSAAVQLLADEGFRRALATG